MAELTPHSGNSPLAPVAPSPGLRLGCSGLVLAQQEGPRRVEVGLGGHGQRQMLLQFC